MNLLSEISDISLKIAGQFREAESDLRQNSPELLNRFREKAFQDFMNQGVPSRKNEDYKYTNLQPAFSREYTWFPPREHEVFQMNEFVRCEVPRLDMYLILLLNGWFQSADSHSLKMPEGILAGSLQRMAAENPLLLEKYYGQLADTSADPVVALNTANARDGFVLYVPRNMQVEQPVQIINLLQAKSDSYVTQRNLVVVEPGAAVRLILCDHTLNLNQYLNNVATEIFIGENASVDFYMIHNRHNQAVTVNSSFFRLEKNSRLTTQTITLHGGLVRNNLRVILDGENSEANLYGMSFMDKKQHVDNFIQVMHEKPNCRSNQQFKNVMDDESTGAFSGRIHVKRDAQKTNAYQKNNNLLLTDKAQMQTKPQLIIEADDVKCSHGATVGQIDEEALFYLRARGIGEKQARLLLMNAFSYEVVKEISVEPLRDRISELIDKRLRGEVSRCHERAYQSEC